MKVLLFQASRTQRVTATRFDNGDWLLSKEWRKSVDDSWLPGKGIMLPKHVINTLGVLLESDGTHSTITGLGLKYLEESEGEITSDFNQKSSNNWNTASSHYTK